MPILNNDGLDDPLLTDACTGFAGGQDSFGPPDQLSPMAAAELVNIDIQDGTATTRRGAIKLGAAFTSGIQGLFWYDKPGTEYLIAAEAGVLKKYDESSWSSCSAYAATSSTAQVCMAQLIEKLYIADGTKNLFEWDGATLTDLGHTTGSPGNPPQGFSFIISAVGRLWGAGIASAPDTIWASYLLDADANGWDATLGNIRIGQGEGDPITGLCEWDDFQIVVFKRNSIYVLRADPTATSYADAAHSLSAATVTRISDTIGCVSHRSIARVGSDIWFLSDHGVYSIGRVLAQTQREVKPAASLPVQDIIERINWQYAHKAAGFTWDNRYFLSLPLDDETAPTSTLVYSVFRQTWAGLWTGWQPQCWALSKANGDERLNFGRSDGGVWRWQDYVQAENAVEATFQDNATNVSTRVVTRAMIFGDPVCPKSALNVSAEFYGSDANASLAVRLDEQAAIALNANFTTSPGVLLLPFTLPATLPTRGLKRRSFGAMHLTQFRSMQTVVASESGKLAVRAVIANGFLNTVQINQ